MVHPMLKVAGVIGGVAVVIDGVSTLMKARDVAESGDQKAAVEYAFAGVITVSAGIIGVAFGYVGNFCAFQRDSTFRASGLVYCSGISGADFDIRC